MPWTCNEGGQNPPLGAQNEVYMWVIAKGSKSYVRSGAYEVAFNHRCVITVWGGDSSTRETQGILTASPY